MSTSTTPIGVAFPVPELARVAAWTAASRHGLRYEVDIAVEGIEELVVIGFRATPEWDAWHLWKRPDGAVVVADVRDAGRGPMAVFATLDAALAAIAEGLDDAE